MNKITTNIIAAMTALTSMACSQRGGQETEREAKGQTFDYHVDRFADLQILRYQVPGFEELSLKEKKLVYYLSQAALEGRDILFDQNGKYNLAIRQTLEAICTTYPPEEDKENYGKLEEYLKRVWFSSGIHHHYSTDKFEPGFTREYFARALRGCQKDRLPLAAFGGSLEKLEAELSAVMFDPTVMPKRVNQAGGEDLIETSASNYYEGVSQAEVEAYYNKKKADAGTDFCPSYGLNSKLVKEGGELRELVWKEGGMYGKAISRITHWLEKAKGEAENEVQEKTIALLIDYYRTGDLRTFDEYSINWLKDTTSHIDFLNGFIETYGDPLGLKASWEGIVNYRDTAATHRAEVLSQEAQWFEDHSPVEPRFRKKEVRGVSAKVITAAILAGDCYPATPIGINLPNSNWIRQQHGSKSVTIENITYAYDQAAKGNGFREEFVEDKAMRALMDRYGFVTDNIHTDLHECLGHGSGQMLPGVSQDALKAYGATVEEARADLFGLYYQADPKLVELGLIDSPEAYKAEYYSYMLNGLMTQLVRIEPGKDIEEAHMRNRQLIARWVFEKGQKEGVMKLKEEGGKTYLEIADYQKVRQLVGELLAEIQRIKSEGDYEAAKSLVEGYGVKVDQELHKEVLERYRKLDLAPYKGFVNPVYRPETDARGEITDVRIDYSEGYREQMLRYGREYANVDAHD